MEREILAAHAASVEAWNRGDLGEHLAIFADDLSAMTKAGPRHGLAPLRAGLASAHFADGRPAQLLVVDQVEIRALSASSALMIGRYILSGRNQPERSGWFSLVWKQTPCGWKIIHDHSS